MEETSERNILGRHQSCSEERVDILLDSMERFYSSRNTPSFLCPESCSDGNWSSQKRESNYVTSSSSKDFLETRLDERIGFRSCSTTRGRSCSTIWKFPIEPTKSKPRSWQNRETRWLPSKRSTNEYMSFENWIGRKAPKIQRPNCTPRKHCEQDSRFYAVFTE